MRWAFVDAQKRLSSTKRKIGQRKNDDLIGVLASKSHRDLDGVCCRPASGCHRSGAYVARDVEVIQTARKRKRERKQADETDQQPKRSPHIPSAKEEAKSKKTCQRINFGLVIARISGLMSHVCLRGQSTGDGDGLWLRARRHCRGSYGEARAPLDAESGDDHRTSERKTL